MWMLLVLRSLATVLTIVSANTSLTMDTGSVRPSVPRSPIPWDIPPPSAAVPLVSGMFALAIGLIIIRRVGGWEKRRARRDRRPKRRR